MFEDFSEVSWTGAFMKQDVLQFDDADFAIFLS